ncbi:glycine cleavage system T protein [Kribbella flavida DSM 17836]|uniref:Aminomethyltransferase n=1 Tax=Kribbella flavida (strain DSM 17836 / JCM 10339 / NBRC 14399) TaxID=479435 RepID=D2PYW5_KRIFD|nr:glycine cleavage system aminomethyltransferase GcvT [Kribbella flavida]ADB31759.1 glycine cleavage system T protein [Kribbella flavida DSM 17836]
MTSLKKSPLHERHVALGAKFAEFGGWEMPLEYSGVVAEHTAVRTSVGVFDVSHLGKARVVGPGAAAYVNSCLTNDLGKIGPGQAQYTLCCAEDGGVVDDLIAYLHADNDVFLIPNAANTAEVVRRLQADAPAGVEVTNTHDDYAILAVQGRNSDEVVGAIGLPTGHDYMAFAVAEYAGTPVVVCRTGYTGERGYELVIPNDAAVAVFDALLAAGEAYGIVPAGLGARDTLRTEMGYPLHGQDISPQITPVQARSGWAVGWKKQRFWGDQALRAEKEAGPAKILRGLRAVGRGIPRPHMTVADADGTALGEVTSGTFSPTLKKGVALALLDARVKEGDQVTVDIRGRQEPFEVVKPPFVTVNVR